MTSKLPVTVIKCNIALGALPYEVQDIGKGAKSGQSFYPHLLLANFLVSGWSKSSILDSDWSAVVISAMKDHNNS